MIDYVQTKNTDAFWKAYNLEKYTILVLEGGTSSSKTFSALQSYLVLFHHLNPNRPLITDFIAESVPKLKVGMINDFEAIMADTYDDKRMHKTDRIYTLPNSNKVRFFNADDVQKVKGPRRDFCMIDEANHISWDVARHILVRTHGLKVITHNPTSEYWAHTELQDRDDVLWVHSTFMDALHVVPESDIKEILSNKEKDRNWWRVYGLGLVGKIEGLVHPNFTVVDEMPIGGVSFYGLDYGYTNDPTCLVHCVVIGDKLYCRQLIYQAGLDNQQIAKLMLSKGVRPRYDEIFCDAAEPKSRAEIARYGFNIKCAPKGRDSVQHGIQKINQFRHYWCADSIDAIKEQRNYCYITDHSGIITNKPVDIWNHAMDARRYGVWGKYQSGLQIALSAKQRV